MTDRVAGNSSFAKDFSARGPRDPRGRSLRDFDLQHRLFKYPCSYLIYSDSFRDLPAAAHDYVDHRLFQVLSGRDDAREFSNLSDDDRDAIMQILSPPGTIFRPIGIGRADHRRHSVEPATRPGPQRWSSTMAGIPLSEPTRQRIELVFDADDLPTATQLLVNECGNNLPFSEKHGPVECERCRFAAIKLSDGRLDLLRKAVAIAKTDWRDLLMAAGFGYDSDAHKQWMLRRRNG